MTITPAKILLLVVCAVSAHTHAQDLKDEPDRGWQRERLAA